MLHPLDFLTTPPPTEHERFNLFVANPPYVRHHHLEAERKAALQRMAHNAGVKLSGLAGLCCYFLVAAHAWMREGGIGVWLVPAEFMDVNYGAALKRYLVSDVTLLRIHRFDPDEVQFNDALVTSAIVFLKKERPSARHPVEFTMGGTLTKPRLRKTLSAKQLQGEKKWARFAVHAPDVARPAHPVLSDFFVIQRGIATGCNQFFVLPLDEINRRQLPREFFRPILPGPRKLTRTHDVIESDEGGVPLLDRRLFVLDCPLPEAELRRRFPTLADYIDEGAQNGYHNRYLCSHRTPWYSQEKRAAPPFFCTYIGRMNTKSGRPFRFIQNNSAAIAANTYLLLYAKGELQTALAANPGLKAEVWRILNDIPLQALLSCGRVAEGYTSWNPMSLARSAPKNWAHWSRPSQRPAQTELSF